jgi:hypothetical protein
MEHRSRQERGVDESTETATAAATPVKLGGETYLLSPMTDEDEATIDRYVQKRFIDMVRASIPEDASPEVYRREMGIGYAEAAKVKAFRGLGADMICSLEGWAFLLFVGLRKHHPEMTATKAMRLLTDPEVLSAAQNAWDDVNRGEGNDEGEDDEGKAERTEGGEQAAEG